jgi:hypothetical protein
MDCNPTPRAHDSSGDEPVYRTTALAESQGNLPLWCEAGNGPLSRIIKYHFRWIKIRTDYDIEAAKTLAKVQVLGPPRP